MIAGLLAFGLVLAGLLAPVAASAAPYGQLESWGSFGTGSGQFSSPLMSGVDSSDGSVYVGDLTKESASTEDREFYRIQKLSPTGTVLGSVEIPRYADSPSNSKIVTLWGIAVDPGLDRFYVLEGGREKETFGEIVAKQIRVYSTVPSAGKLVAPAGGPATLPVPTGANFVNGLFKPRGIQVDPSNGDLVIMAENKAAPKRTLFQRISSAGVAGAKFSDADNVLRSGSESAFAFTVGPDGTTYTMTGRAGEPAGHTRAWEVPQSMASLAQVPGFAAAIDAEELSFGLESAPQTTLAGGPEIAISPDGGTLFWKERLPEGLSTETAPGNMLVRGFSLDDLATTVVYGGGAAGACRIETSASGLGTVGEKLVVFDYGPLNEEKSLTPAYGPKVRTFGSGGSGCLAPVAKFKANGSEGDVKVAKGTTVNFDASPSVLTSGPSATPGFRRELVWDFGDGNTEVVKGSGGGEAALTTSHKYDTAGNFTASLQIRLKQPNYGNPAPVTHGVEVEGAVETKFALSVTLGGSGSGTVTSSPAGINCGLTCGVEFTEDTVVKLTGTPNVGSKAVAWSNCDAIVGSNECQVTMSAAKAVTANFDLQTPQLSVVLSGTGSVASSPGGISCGADCTQQFDFGTAVKLTGTPSGGAKPVVWTGCDAIVGSNECEVAMTAAKEVTATFSAPGTNPLIVTKSGSGGGLVQSDPAGIECGEDCSEGYQESAVVKLAGTPAPGSKAVVWSGCDAIVGSNECQVTMSAAKNVTATFDREQRSLGVTKNGTGGGTVTSAPAGINCGPTCAANFELGAVIKLSGAPAAGSKAVVWSGCDTIVGSNECQVTVDSVESVTATFDLAPAAEFVLTVTKAGSGAGAVTSAPAGINCGSACTEDFVDGTVVKLTGTPNAGSKAVVWSGCDTIVGSNECQVTMSSAKGVTATFDLVGQVALTVTLAGSGEGTVESSPTGIECGEDCGEDYTEGSVVKLTGTAGANTQVVAWSGCDAIVGANECQVTMSAARAVTASFALEQRRLTIAKAGTGMGWVASSPAGIGCGGSCLAEFDLGTVVRLTGVAAAGVSDVVWSGCDAIAAGNRCEVTLGADRGVTATFAPPAPDLGQAEPVEPEPKPKKTARQKALAKCKKMKKGTKARAKCVRRANRIGKGNSKNARLQLLDLPLFGQGAGR